MAFIDQVQDLTSLTVSDNDELSQFLKDGVIDVTNRWLIVKPQDIESFTRESSEQTSNGFNPGTSKIVSVIRENGTDGQWYPCNKKSINLQYLVTDIDSLHYASKYNPVYMITQNRNVHVFPAPSVAGNDGFKVLYVNYDPEESDGTDLQHDSTGIKWFPDDKVYLVVMYAGIRLLHAALAAKSAPSVPVSQVLPALNITATDPTAISLTTISYLPITASTSTALTSLTAPTYTKPTIVLGAAPTISDLSVTAVPPDAPTISTISYSSAAETDIGSVSDVTVTAITFPTADIPTYTKTSLQTARVSFDTFYEDTSSSNPFGTSSDPGELSVTAVPPDTPDTPELSSVGTAPTYDTSVATSALAEANNFIDSDEDVELANAKLAEVQALMQDELNEFNQENIAFQATIQRETQEDTLILQKYQADLGVYQAEVGAQVQEYTQKLQRYSTELSNVFQAWQKTESDSLQEYQLNIQNELNDFNMENADFQLKFQEVVQEAKDANQVALQNMQKDLARAQADAQSDSARRLQDAIQSMQDDVANNASLIQKFQTEIQEYQAEVATQIQEYQQNLAGDLQVWQAERQTDLQKYGTDVQNELNEFNKENASFGYEVQKALADAQATNQVALQNGVQQARDAIENNNAQVARFQSMSQHYATQVNEDIQKYTVQVQAFTADIQASTAEHGAELQGTQAEYQWLQDQYVRLKAEYDQAFMIAAPQQQAAQEAA